MGYAYFGCFISSTNEIDSTSSSWITLYFIHSYDRATAFLSPHGKDGRWWKFQASILFLYAPFFKLEPREPLFFSILATISCFLKFILIALIDLKVLSMDLFVLLVTSITCERKECKSQVLKMDTILHPRQLRRPWLLGQSNPEFSHERASICIQMFSWIFMSSP